MYPARDYGMMSVCVWVSAVIGKVARATVYSIGNRYAARGGMKLG